MHKRFPAILLGLVAGLALCAAEVLASGLPSQPTSVLFYPNEAQITVDEELPAGRLQGRRLTLTIPAGANQDSFFASAPGNQVVGVFWHDEEDELPDHIESTSSLQVPAVKPIMPLDPADEPSAERRALLQKYLTLLDAEAAMLGKLNTAKARYAFWTRDNSGKEGMKFQDLQSFDKGIEQNLPKITQEAEIYAASLAGLTYKRVKAEGELREYDEQHRTREVDVLLREAPAGAVKIRYSYIVPAEYSTNYRVSATPDKGTVGIDQQAVLTQRSGMSWKNVEVMLSTTRRDMRVSPGALHAWWINIYEKGQGGYQANQRVRKEAAPMAAKADMSMIVMEEMAAPEPVPTQEEHSTFRLWKLGKRTLESDTPLVVDLAQDSHKAEFYYTLRPSVDPRGYLTAKLEFPEAVELAPGRAQFLVDETAVGWQIFALSGKEAYLFFGADPQVSAAMRAVERVEGEQGLISKDQTLAWHWEFTVKNGRSRPVDVRLEEPVPTVGNKDIKLVVTSTPKPEEADDLAKNERAYIWKAQLKPGEEFKIDHKVSLTAPADKELSPGRW